MTTMGTRLLQEVWPTLQSEGALTGVTYQRITAGSITSTSLVTGTPSGASTVSTSVAVLLSDYRSFEVDGARIVQGDRRARVLKDALSADPTTNDRIVLDSTTYRIITVGQPADGATWQLQLRTP